MADELTIPQQIQQAINGPQYKVDEWPQPNHAEGVTELGTEYFGAIVFKVNGADQTPYVLIDCTYTLRESATIVREMPAGETDKRKGSVLELTAINDFDITIAARLVTNHNERMPTDELQLMRQKIKAGALLDVENREFNILGIQQLVVEDIEYKAEEGMVNTLMVNIKAYSHQPDELLINDVEDPTDDTNQ
jgi:hypothetical protein